jgi:hypothetical protein
MKARCHRVVTATSSAVFTSSVVGCLLVRGFKESWRILPYFTFVLAALATSSAASVYFPASPASFASSAARFNKTHTEKIAIAATEYSHLRPAGTTAASAFFPSACATSSTAFGTGQMMLPRRRHHHCSCPATASAGCNDALAVRESSSFLP